MSKLTMQDNVSREVLNNEKDTELSLVACGEHIGRIRFGSSLKMTQNYQSVGVDIGVDLPWSMPPGDTDSVKNGFRYASDLIEEELRVRVGELKELLRKVTAR